MRTSASSSNQAGRDWRVSFEVRTAWKGTSPSVVLKQGQGADCVFPFEAGHDYLVFAHADEGGGLSANAQHCGFTRPAEDACEVLGRLGPPLPSSLAPSVVAAAAASLLVSLALAGFRRTRRAAVAAVLIGGAAVVVVWRLSRPPPDYDALAVTAPAAVADVPRGVEHPGVPRDGEYGGPILFTPAGDAIVGLENFHRQVCWYPLADIHKARCVEVSGADGMSINQAGTQLALGANEGLELLALPSLAPTATLQSTEFQHAQVLEFTADDKGIVAGMWGSVKLIDVSTQGVLRALGPRLCTGRVAFSGDGRRAASGWSELGSDDRWRVVVGVFNVDDGRELAKFSRSCGGAWGRNVSLDHRGQRLAWAESAGVQVFDVEGQTKLSELAGAGAGAMPELSPDGRRVALAGSEVGVWDSASGRQLLRFPSEAGVGPLAFSPDGRRLAVGADKVIRILDVEPR